MSDVMAIVSKAVFEKAAGKSPALGTVLGLDRYASANRGLAALAGGGRLFLVTVRPPDEALWLVAVLDNPAFKKEEWVAKASPVPLTDLSALKRKLTFENGKGLPETAGTLGMSLQTPRVLTAADVALLESVLAGAGAAGSSATSGRGAKAAAAAAPAAAPDPAEPLWAAVRAAPHDDAPRLALAEHWRATGEPRGELALVDRQLRGRLSRHLRLSLRARRDELIAEHGQRWWPWKVSAHRQRAGLLTAVTTDAGSLAGVAKLLAVEPVTELELTDVDEDSIAQVAKAPWLARLTTLLLRGGIGDDGLATLVKSKHVAGLQALNLSSSELSAEGLAALGDRLPALRRLVLTNNPFGDEGAEALATWKHLGQLRALYLTSCELSAEGVTALLATGQLARLEKWTLSQNELGDAVGRVIAEHASGLSRLSFLELREVGLRDAGSQALAQAALPALRHLDVSGNRASYAALRAAYGDAVRR